MIDVAPEDANPFCGVLHIHLGFVLDILRCLEIVQRDSAFVVKQLGPFELYSRKFSVGDRLSIIGKGSGHVRALHPEEELALFHRVAEARVKFHHATGGNRNDRNAASNVRSDRSRYGQL